MSKVYILGAGCSVCGGYPVASQVTAEMLTFARSILARDDSKELRRCTLDTCRRMMEAGVETIDQLADLLNRQDLEGGDEAKIAMSVYFLSLEERAIVSALSSYTQFFEELFRYGNSKSIYDRVISTPARVITYNYDRLFERTFIEWVKSIEPHNEDLANNPDSFIGKYLNYGLGVPRKLVFKSDCFSFLKLHGGIGQFYRNEDPSFKHIYRPKLRNRIPEYTDENYYKTEYYKDDIPMLVFPSDKYVENRTQNGSSYADYINTFESQSITFCRQAEEIHIIGYSIQPIDFFSFKAMIAAAKDCARIIVRNRLTEKARLMRILEGLKDELAAPWEIEFRAEDFYGVES